MFPYNGRPRLRPFGVAAICFHLGFIIRSLKMIPDIVIYVNLKGTSLFPSSTLDISAYSECLHEKDRAHR